MLRLISGLVVLFIAGTAAAQTPSLQDVAGKLLDQHGAATIYFAREFLTMDPGLPKAEAVAVRDGRFIAVGALKDVQAASGNNSMMDKTFEGKVVTAGFVEQHVHPVLAALTMATNVLRSVDGFHVHGDELELLSNGEIVARFSAED